VAVGGSTRGGLARRAEGVAGAGAAHCLQCWGRWRSGGGM